MVEIKVIKNPYRLSSRNRNIISFYFPQPSPEIERSSSWAPILLTKNDIRIFLERIKYPRDLEVVVYNLGEFLFEVVKKIIERLGSEKIEEIYVKIWQLEQGRKMDIKVEEGVPLEDVEKEVIEIIKETEKKT